MRCALLADPNSLEFLYGFEKAVEFFYQYIFTKPKESYSKLTQLLIAFASG